MSTDAEFEGFLQRFQPRPPRPLPESYGWRWYGIGAGIAVALVALWWLWPRSTPPSPAPPKPHDPQAGSPPRIEVRGRATPTLGRMRALALQDPDVLDRVLEDDARRLLPDVEGSRGTLGELWKESRS